MFGEFLDRDPKASQPSANNEDTTGVDFLKYIEVHLQAKKCPSPCSRLWSVNLFNFVSMEFYIVLQEILFEQQIVFFI